MPTYEMPLLLRVMTKPETFTALKRVASNIFDKGGFIRKIDNLGQRATPYKIQAHGAVFREASYFIIHFDAPPRRIHDLYEENSRDADIIKHKTFKQLVDPPKECTFHKEMLPTPYRPEVQKLMRIAAKKKIGYAKEFKYNCGLDYYPFPK